MDSFKTDFAKDMAVDNYFTITLGVTRIEFSVGFENGFYVGKVNEITLYRNIDYEAVRSAMIESMNDTKVDLSKLN